MLVSAQYTQQMSNTQYNMYYKYHLKLLVGLEEKMCPRWGVIIQPQDK